MCVCVCVFPVCQLCWTFYSKLSMAIRFSEAFKGLQLTDLSKMVYFKRFYFVLTFGLQVSHFIIVHMAVLVLHGCIAGGGIPCYWARPLALYGAHLMLRGKTLNIIWWLIRKSQIEISLHELLMSASRHQEHACHWANGISNPCQMLVSLSSECTWYRPLR